MTGGIVTREVVGLMALGVFCWLAAGLIVGGAIEIVSGYRAHRAEQARRSRRRKRRRIARKKAVIVEQSAKRLARAIGNRWNVAEGTPLFSKLVKVCEEVIADCEKTCQEVRACD